MKLEDIQKHTLIRIVDDDTDLLEATELMLTFSGWRRSPGLQLIGCDDTISRIPRYHLKLCRQCRFGLNLPTTTSIRLWA